MKIEVRNPGESHAEFAYRVLRSNILTLNMKPGMVINEKEIAAQLKISRTPVHEAVLKLKYEFLIDVRARKESKVSYIDVDLRRFFSAAYFGNCCPESSNPSDRSGYQEKTAGQPEGTEGDY